MPVYKYEIAMFIYIYICLYTAILVERGEDRAHSCPEVGWMGELARAEGSALGQPQHLAARVCWARGTRGGGPPPSERGSGLGACCAALHLLSQPSNSRHWVLFWLRSQSEPHCLGTRLQGPHVLSSLLDSALSFTPTSGL